MLRILPVTPPKSPVRGKNPGSHLKVSAGKRQILGPDPLSPVYNVQAEHPVTMADWPNPLKLCILIALRAYFGIVLTWVRSRRSQYKSVACP